MKGFFNDTRDLTKKQIQENIRKAKKISKQNEKEYAKTLEQIKLRVAQRPLLIESEKRS